MKFFQQYLLFSLFFSQGISFTQEVSDSSSNQNQSLEKSEQVVKENQEESQPLLSEPIAKSEIPLKFRGPTSSGNAIALVVSNRNPISPQIPAIISDLNSKGYRIALTKSDIDIKNLNSRNSPFVSEVNYVLKFSVFNLSSTEQLLRLNIEMLRLSDGKVISKEVAVPRSNIKMLTSDIEKLFNELIPKKILQEAMIFSVKNNKVYFPQQNYSSLRRGDEITIRYPQARNGQTESYAIVCTISNDVIVAKDLAKQAKSGDSVLNIIPMRNRISLSLGVIVPTLGESIISATYNSDVWSAAKRWPAGLKIEGEYERLLPYQLVSTTVFGLNIDGTMGTYIHTGIGYRIIHRSWEFIPYLRLGVMYNPLSLKLVSGSAGNLQGMVLRFGLSTGISLMKRVNKSIFVGTDIGLQWYPLNIVSVVSGTEKINPSWNNNGQFTEQFSMTALYPYISLKVGWLF